MPNPFRVVILGLDELKRRLSKNIGPLFSEALDEIGEAVLDNVVSETPKKTGATQGSHKLKKAGDLERQITTGAIGALLLDGSPPHPIFPRKARALAWPGIAHPVPMVNHPGFPKNEYNKRGVDKSSGDVEKALKKFGDKVIS